ncbi:hypothetical protein TcCL_ESM02573 [Trypanosoma cruzi]|nr:hypothetical protein TcCL_ESM02573 [Trypanosoma cruzi]
MPLNPGRKRPQPSQAANNGKYVKEEHEPHKGRLCSCRVATQSIVVVNRWFSPPQPKKGIIHPPVIVDEASSIIPAFRNKRASAVEILPEPLRALPEEDGGKGDRPTRPQTCMRLSKVAGFNWSLIHSRFNTGTLARCCNGMACSSCGVVRRVLVARLVIVAA